MNSAPTPNPATVTLIQQPPRRGCVRYVILGILLLVLLSAVFTLNTHAEEYTPPAEESAQEEPHETVQVQGVQTYDQTLYEKLDTLQESLNTLIDLMTPAETGTEDAQSGELVQDYTAQLETISGQLVDLRTAADMATAETAQPAAFEKPFADLRRGLLISGCKIR